jgi:hypothetical protein
MRLASTIASEPHHAQGDDALAVGGKAEAFEPGV